MTEPYPQEPEGLSRGPIWLVGVGVVVISAALIAIAWGLVIPAPTGPSAASPSPLEHGLIDHATRGGELRTAGEQRLERYDWVDRTTRTVQIPIERAIDAVVAEPGLIGARSRAIAGAGNASVGDASPARDPATGAVAGATAGEGAR